MYKKASILCAALIGICLAVACGGQEEPTKVDTDKPAGGSGAGSSGGRSGGGSAGATGGASVDPQGGASGAGTGGAGGSGGASPTPRPTPAPDAGAEEGGAPDSASAPMGAGPFGCAGCKPLFDGMSLEGWETRDPTNWLAKDGVLASQGKVAPIWTKADLGDYRLFFQVRQVKGNHKPDVIFFGKRPGPDGGKSGALGGAQFQPPNGGSWNYGAGGKFNRPENPGWDETKWHQCEVLVKEAGSFKAACCPMEPASPCQLVLTWEGNGRKHPFAIQMHNPGLFDEYKNIFIEENPAEDELLCLKKQP